MKRYLFIDSLFFVFCICVIVFILCFTDVHSDVFYGVGVWAYARCAGKLGSEIIYDIRSLCNSASCSDQDEEK